MENDSIRASGSSTLVDLWIDGRLRAISISREAVEGLAGPGSDKTLLTDTDRCEFVRTHMGLILAMAKERLRTSDPDAASIAIDAHHRGGPSGAPATERRKGDRRKGDRRKNDRPDARVPGDRRTVERRKGDRRKKS